MLTTGPLTVAAVPKEVILTSDRLIAAEFFTRMYGESAGKAISVIIGLSAIGNVLSVLFGQGRVNQELGREGVLPFSKFWASNKPFNSPFAGLGLQWAVTLIIMLAPPGGDIYSFLLNLISCEWPFPPSVPPFATRHPLGPSAAPGRLLALRRPARSLGRPHSHVDTPLT